MSASLRLVLGTHNRNKIRELAQVVRDAEFLIESVSASDATPQMMTIYHFSHPDQFCRVTARVLIDREAPSCPTIEDIYPGANWHERETDDFFGIELLPFAGEATRVGCRRSRIASLTAPCTQGRGARNAAHEDFHHGLLSS